MTTIRQEVLDELGLEILGRIHSKGVHGSKTTNLYKAKLLIGNQEMEIEVSPVLSQIWIRVLSQTSLNITYIKRKLSLTCSDASFIC